MRKLRKGESYALLPTIDRALNTIKRSPFRYAPRNDVAEVPSERLPRHSVPRNDDDNGRDALSNSRSSRRCNPDDDEENSFWKLPDHVRLDYQDNCPKIPRNNYLFLRTVCESVFNVFKRSFQNREMPIQNPRTGKINVTNNNFLSSILQVCCLFFICVLFSDAQAQSAGERAVAGGQEGIKALQIGDLMYDIQLDKTINPHTGQSPARLSEFSGKVVILDFWATWCAPCIAMLPKMDSIQRTYSDKLQFLSVTSETETVVRSFLDRMQAVHSKKSSLTYVVEDRLLKQMFPHASIPHYVWIDGRGKVIAITGMEEINGENIEKAIAGQELNLPIKSSFIAAYDKTKPFLFNEENIRGAELILNSALTGYIDGIGGGHVQTVTIKDDNHVNVAGANYRRISARNLSIAQLYQLAFADGIRSFRWSNTELSVQRPIDIQSFESGEPYVDWKRNGHGFCYELIIAKDRAADAWDIMKDDLKRHFPQYVASVEARMTPSICLVRTSDVDKMATKGGEQQLSMGAFGGRINLYPLSYLLRELGDKGLQGYHKPLVNLTNYTEPVDLVLEGQLNNISNVNKALEPYDLKLIEQDQVVEVLVIRDAGQK